MIPFAMFVVLLNSTINVPKSHWTAIDVKIQAPATVLDCDFSVRDGRGRVDAILMTRQDAERFNHGLSYRPLASTGYEKSAHLRYEVEQPGDYIVLLDNRLEARWAMPVSVAIELWNPAAVHPVMVSTPRRLAIITLTLLFFVAVVVFSARQFRPNQFNG